MLFTTDFAHLVSQSDDTTNATDAHRAHSEADLDTVTAMLFAVSLEATVNQQQRRHVEVLDRLMQLLRAHTARLQLEGLSLNERYFHLVRAKRCVRQINKLQRCIARSQESLNLAANVRAGSSVCGIPVMTTTRPDTTLN